LSVTPGVWLLELARSVIRLSAAAAYDWLGMPLLHGHYPDVGIANDARPGAL
jgi:hypothetical protein